VASLRFINARVARASLLSHIRSQFTSPPASIGWSRPFNVYGIQQMMDSGFTPTEPFVFVVAAHTEPTMTIIPLVIFDPTFDLDPYELGNRGGCTVNMTLLCWGRTRAERDDIATLLANVYAQRTEKGTRVTIWTSLSDTSPAGYAEVTSPVLISFPTAGSVLSAEGTLRNWTIVSFTMRIK